MPDPRSAGTQRGARPRSGGGAGPGGLLPILGIVVIALVAIAAGRMIAKQRDEAGEVQAGAADAAETASGAQAPDLFAGWEREQRPAPSAATRAGEAGAGASGGTASLSAGRASPLWQDPLWQEALAIGEQARELTAQALRARDRGDAGGYQEKGKQAKEAFDRAFTMTVELEERLLATYPENDPGVRAIVRERTEWSDKMRVLHKTTGR